MKNIAIGIIGLVIIGGGAIAVLTSQNDGNVTNTTNPPATSAPAEPSASPPAAPQASTARFVDYTPTAIADAMTEKRVLFFHANWCPTCKALERNIQAGEIPDNLTIIKTDYDAESDLKKMYGVTFQHTLVQVDKDGNSLGKWAGSRDIDEIVAELQ